MRRLIRKKIIVGLCVCFVFLSIPTLVDAGNVTTPAPYSSLQGTTVTLTNPIGSTDIPTIIGRAIKQLLAIVGGIALLAFVVGGAYWLISAGNADRVKKGTQTMLWAAIGLAVVFSSYGLLYTLIGGLTNNNNLSAPSGGAGLQSGAFYMVGETVATIHADPRTNGTSRGTIAATVPCILSTGKKQNGFIEVQSPSNTALIGWVSEGVLRLMSPEEVVQLGCGGAQRVGDVQGNVCTCMFIASDGTRDGRSTVPSIDTGAECLQQVSKPPFVVNGETVTLSECQWQPI